MLLAFFALCKFSSDAHFTFCRGIFFFVKTGSIYFVATGCFSSSDLFFFFMIVLQLMRSSASRLRNKNEYKKNPFFFSEFGLRMFFFQMIFVQYLKNIENSGI